MELHLKQWRDQHESEQQPSVKIPKLFLEPHQAQGSSALPLFVPELTSKLSSLSAFPDSTTRCPRPGINMGSYFSLAQRQELELQALIYRYMLAGAAVPPELLLPIKRSLLLHDSPSYFLHYSHYQPQPNLLQWGRGAMDPEPGRCRRTDGKKWRCSRDVVAGHKYCERHMHRGRSRSRKPVEIPTPSTNTTTTSPIVGVGDGDGDDGHAVGTLTIAASPLALVDLLHFNQSSSSSTCKTDPQNGADNNNINNNSNNNNRSDGHTLRHFFDDWPRSLEEPNNASTCLSMSMPGNASDVSLKLSTGGNGEEPEGHHQHQPQEPPHLNWATGWATNPMGGPLAEALRSSSSTSNSSPTSVLHQHQLPRNSASETSYVST